MYHIAVSIKVPKFIIYLNLLGMRASTSTPQTYDKSLKGG